MPTLSNSEIVLNPDGSVYHLKVVNDDLADDIILVGDPERVGLISGMFDKVDRLIRNREFITATGIYSGKRITVLATGIGVDNIDIVLNELHIAANYDPVQGAFTGTRSFNLVRLGTSGGLQEDIIPGSTVLAEYGIGIDGLFYYYRDIRAVLDTEAASAFIRDTAWPPQLPTPYVAGCSFTLANRFNNMADHRGFTITAPGFYAPQGRMAALPLAWPDLNNRIASFAFNQKKVLNYEMETSALYALGRSLGHKTLTICLVVANRKRREFLRDYQPAMKAMAQNVLQSLASE
jgi:uridine phosphorylase